MKRSVRLSLLILVVSVAFSFQNCTKQSLSFATKGILNQSIFVSPNNGTGYTGKVSFVETNVNLCPSGNSILKQIDVDVVQQVAQRAQLVVSDCNPIAPVDLKIEEIRLTPDLATLTYQSQVLSAVPNSGPTPAPATTTKCTDTRTTLLVRYIDGRQYLGSLYVNNMVYDLQGFTDTSGAIVFYQTPPPPDVKYQIQSLTLFSEIKDQVRYEILFLQQGTQPGVLTCSPSL